MLRFAGIARSSHRGSLRQAGGNGSAATRLVFWGIPRHCNLFRVMPRGTGAEAAGAGNILIRASLRPVPTGRATAMFGPCRLLSIAGRELAGSRRADREGGVSLLTLLLFFRFRDSRLRNVS